MARKKGRILPFRIPFFRIFYSTTYTVLFILCLVFLAITPASLIWTSVQNTAFQYIIMVGGTYILTGMLAIFIYTSRLYTNRTVLAGVGKAYIPVEEGELGRNVRKMIVTQLERSAIIAWESRPRDLVGEILQAERQGLLPPETSSIGPNDYTVGRMIPVDPDNPPWGHVRHPGWSSPSQGEGNKNPDVQYANVIAELPNLIEARAVSSAPPDPTSMFGDHTAMADPVVAELLRRPPTMGIRDYLTQLSYLGLVTAQGVGQSFLRQYEHARFCGRPITDKEFDTLMKTFSELLSGMSELSPAIVEQIRIQNGGRTSANESHSPSSAPSRNDSATRYKNPPRPHSTDSPGVSPVTARSHPSKANPYPGQNTPSLESLSSVVRREPTTSHDLPQTPSPNHSAPRSRSSLEIASDAGSVLRHPPDGDT